MELHACCQQSLGYLAARSLVLWLQLQCRDVTSLGYLGCLGLLGLLCYCVFLCYSDAAPGTSQGKYCIALSRLFSSVPLTYVSLACTIINRHPSASLPSVFKPLDGFDMVSARAKQGTNARNCDIATNHHQQQLWHWRVTKKDMRVSACMLQSEINVLYTCPALNSQQMARRRALQHALSRLQPWTPTAAVSLALSVLHTAPDSIANTPASTPRVCSSKLASVLAAWRWRWRWSPKPTHTVGNAHLNLCKMVGCPCKSSAPRSSMHPKSATQNPEKESCMPKREEETWVALCPSFAPTL